MLLDMKEKRIAKIKANVFKQSLCTLKNKLKNVS